ncbi:dienelactone hydrolase family protein [Trinickia mobilis]|uniref:dienelactone hydrolase family protein n=1 Tax=Trinickia mobilis TaxID=2816356 RepID=UPI001A8E4B26|nr:prolyl oligopeptidase family serine peptidase [Trinickia mobilis]
MSLKNMLTGCMAACALSVAQADPLAIANIAAAGPLSKAHVPNLEYHDAYQPNVAADLNEQIIRIPVDASGSVTLETTIFKPNGSGPFPMVVFNHGKIPGDPRDQARSRPIAFAREFVRRGYLVVAPNREGFAGSGGTYQQAGCDVERNGVAQADDVAATVAYMSKQPYVDAQHVVVAGSSHGGLTTMAYGVNAAPGVRGLINFSGGLRQDACSGWQNNLTQAFETYGQNTQVPSLWLYGDNDSVWTPSLAAKMYAAYVAHGAHAQMVDFGDYKNDAHRLVVDRDGVSIWWPSVEAFLAHIGMPTSIQYRVDEPSMPKASGYAALDAVSAVPFLDASGRAGYQNFLKQYPTRAFAVSDSGAWSWAEGGDNPMALAIQNCEKEGAGTCHLYAVNDAVVWKDGHGATPAATAQATADAPAADDRESHALASR